MYVESSALLSVLLDEPEAGAVTEAMVGCEHFVTSALTFLECRRALVRLVTDGKISHETANSKAAVLGELRRAWWVLAVDALVLDIAGEPFDLEPVRSLDAVHLASAWFAQKDGPLTGGLVVLSRDRRVRLNTLAFGVDVAPAPTLEEISTAREAVPSLPFGGS